jgi:hypothetical protein
LPKTFSAYLGPPSISSDHLRPSRTTRFFTGGSRLDLQLSVAVGSLWISSHHQQLLPLDLLAPPVALGSRSSQSLSGPRSWLSASSSASQLHRLILQCLSVLVSRYSCHQISLWFSISQFSQWFLLVTMILAFFEASRISWYLSQSFSAFLIFSCSRISFGRSSHIWFCTSHATRAYWVYLTRFQLTTPSYFLRYICLISCNCLVTI